MKIYPYYPKPIKNKASIFTRYFKNRRSWLNSLYERSYTMKMGEFKVPLIDIYIVNEPDLIHRVMVTEVKFFPKHHLQHEMLKPVLGESIFTTNGKVWKKQRELLNPSFEMTRISHVFDLMQEASQDLLARLEKRNPNTYTDIDKEMTFVTADIIFRTILSKKLTLEEGEKIVKAFEIFQETSAKITMLKIFKIPKIFHSKKLESSYKESGNIIRQSLADIIQPRYDDSLNKNAYKDILSTLLKVIDEETAKPFSFQEILDQVAMLFLAGHETSASSLTWTLYLLALYPEHQESAYEEIIHACGKEKFSVQNIKELTFLTKIVKESLRLYPPVSFFPRETVEATTMRNKKLKKGSVVVVSPWLMHRNNRYWEDPHMFNPHRFDDPKSIHKHTYFPFGMGQRVCIGSAFAMQETLLLLASMIREYKLEVEPGFTPDIVGRLTTRSLNGLNVKFIKREGVS
ncbi:MAG: Cytochrome P450 family protein [uncultured Sulfurovum sp.]|uniref:Cytochrome P450 family protein n=1 Tax=uncultured Sulfurovum sp. TaxID=269237 RepID=A0A6S6SC58_9BACT|nr:MAG: Cytochrome P450 family protein [uncultured Sulfurovum sp.]